MDTQKFYDLEDVALPRLAGTSLKLFAAALENRATSGPLIQKLLADAGISAFRAQRIDEAPTPHPLANEPQTPPRAYDQADVDAAVKAAAALPQHLAHGERQVPGSHFATVRDYANAYEQGMVTPRVVAERFLGAESGEAGALHAFINVKPDDVLAQADAATERWRAGAPLSIFDGVPVAVKDELDQAGHPTTVGTAFLGGTPVTEDAAAVARLRALGALLVGKANMHEIGIGVTGLNPHHGVVRNPYNVGHHSGGSSSGPGAAVGAGLCPLAVGADGGGSIRIPAAFCGVFGLKASYGRVSGRGAAPLDWSLGHVGPLAATAHDLLLGYAAMAGPDAAEPVTRFQPLPALPTAIDGDLSGLTLGIFRPWFDHADSAVVSPCSDVVRGLEERGATVREIVIPELDLLRLGQLITIASEMATALMPYDAAHRTDYGLDVRLNLALARAFTARDYIHAQRARTRAIAHFRRALEQVHVVVTPTTAIAAPPIRAAALPDGESDLTTLGKIMRFVVAGNFTGLPALSAPAGYTAAGLPVGIQFIGRYWDEVTLLRLAFVVESLVERQAPQLHVRLL